MLRNGICVRIWNSIKRSFVLRSSFVSCSYLLYKYDCSSIIITLITHHDICINPTLICALLSGSCNCARCFKRYFTFGGNYFQSRREHRLLWRKFFVIFLISSSALSSVAIAFFPHPLEFPVIRWFEATWYDSLSTPLNKQQICKYILVIKFLQI
jgi:hypothetical protein